jgi:hypothetical protein
MPMPKYSPVRIEELLCIECGQPLKPRVQRREDGKVQGVSYICIPCQYVHDTGGLQYSTGTQRPAKPDELGELERRPASAG